MIPYPRRSRPATTCFSVLRILVAVALTTQLADSATLDEAPDWFSDSHEATASGSVPRESEDDKGALTPASSSGAQGKDSTRNANFRLRGQGFEVFYKVSNSVNDEDATISHDEASTMDEIYLTPEEQDEPDNTHGNRIGPGNIPGFMVNEECMNSLICHEVQSYPKEAMEQIVKTMSSGLSEFATPISEYRPADRMGGGGSDDGRSLCRAESKSWRPQGIRKGVKSDEPWYLVVNVPSMYVQEFQVTYCVNPDDSCANLDSPEHYRTVCRQKYVNRKVVVLDHSNKPVVDSFPIPASCCCHVKGFSLPGERFGGNAARVSKPRMRLRRDNTRDRRHRHPRDN